MLGDQQRRVGPLHYRATGAWRMPLALPLAGSPTAADDELQQCRVLASPFFSFAVAD